MRLRGTATGTLMVLMSTCLAPNRAQTQGAGAVATTRVIDLYQGGPVADALGILRERYHLAITYQDPVYVEPSPSRPRVESNRRNTESQR